MLWLLLAMGAGIAFATSSITDKVLLRDIKSSSTVNYLGGSMSAIVGIAVLLLHERPFDPTVAGIGFIIGILGFAAVGVYLIAMQHEEASRVVPLWTFTDVGVAVLAFALLHEPASPLLWISIAIVIVGSVLLESDHRGILTRKPFVIILMSIASFTWAFGIILIRRFNSTGDPITLWAWQLLGTGTCGLVLLIANRARVQREVRTIRMFLCIVVSQTTEMLGIFFKFIALSFAFAAPIQVVTDASSYIFVFIATLICSRWFPKFLREEINRATIGRKGIALALITVGLVIASSAG